MRKRRRLAAILAAAGWLSMLPGVATAQDAGVDPDSLAERARSESPRIAAAERAAAEARARAEAAGALPDPHLAVGLVNALVSDPFSSQDLMTMRTVRLGTTLPYPGKLALDREAARWRLAAAEAEREATVREVVAEVRRTFYELAFLDRALEVVRTNHTLLADLRRVTVARYGVGSGPQQDVLRAEVEATRLGDETLRLEKEREAALARLNAHLDRPVDTPVEAAAIPERIARMAVPDPGEKVVFTVAPLDETDGDAGPLPSRAALLEAGRTNDPRLVALRARVNVRRVEAERASMAALPDFDLSVGYGQRSGREDMITVLVSAPLPIFKGRKQDPLAEGAAEGALAVEAELAARTNEIEAEIAALRASLVRTRERLALLQGGVLPQARTSLESAIAGYPVDVVDLPAVLDSQVTLFRHELDRWRLLTRFASDLAELERITGTEALR